MEKFSEERQQQFLEEKLEEFAEVLFGELSRQAREKVGHVPTETLRNLSYKIIADDPNAASTFVMSLQDSGRMVDMRRINFTGRAISNDENFILEWAKKKGRGFFKKQVPGYKRGSKSKLTEEQEIERIASAIIVAKGSQKRRRRRKRSWRYNKTVYGQIEILIDKLLKDQADWLRTQISEDLRENLGFEMDL